MIRPKYGSLTQLPRHTYLSFFNNNLFRILMALLNTPPSDCVNNCNTKEKEMFEMPYLFK